MSIVLLVQISTISSAGENRRVRALVDIGNYSQALEFYKTDNGVYPAESIGLSALMPDESALTESARNGYLKSVGKDPWGFSYQYRYPGKHNADGFDLWSNGADGKIGGDGANTDCGNWEDSQSSCTKGHYGRKEIQDLLFYSAIFAAIGLLIGSPIYLVAMAIRRKNRQPLFWGFHTLALFYLSLIGPVIFWIVLAYFQLSN